MGALDKTVGLRRFQRQLEWRCTVQVSHGIPGYLGDTTPNPNKPSRPPPCPPRAGHRASPISTLQPCPTSTPIPLTASDTMSNLRDITRVIDPGTFLMLAHRTLVFTTTQVGALLLR